LLHQKKNGFANEEVLFAAQIFQEFPEMNHKGN